MIPFKLCVGWARLRAWKGLLHRVPLLPCTCALAVLLATRPAGAQNPSTPTTLEYHASADCPTEAVFLAELRARTASFVRADGNLGGRSLEIAVDTSHEAPVGRLRMVEPSGEETTREVAGRTCGQVVAALALVTALALDPNASIAPRPTPEDAPRPLASVPHVTQDGRWRLSAALHAGVTGAVAPGVAIAVPVFVELGHEPAAAGAWTPSARLAFERGFGTSIQVAQGDADFEWTVGRLDLCAALALSQRVALGPCVGVDVGTLAGAGAGGIANRNQSSRPWVALAALARARWKVFPPLFLEMEAGAVFPTVRDDFIFEQPRIPLYSVPFVGPRASAGLGAYFW